MKKFKSTIPDGGLKFFNKFLESELGSEIWNAIEGLIAHSINLEEGIVLTGGTVSGASPNAAITESIVMLNGKLLRLPATTGQTYPFYIQEATTVDVNEDYADGSSKATIDNEAAEVVAAAPTGQYITVSAAGELVTGLNADSVIDQNLGKRIRHKIIAIGDWNMDTTTSVTISHGLGANPNRIIDMQAIIFNDSGEDAGKLTKVSEVDGSALGNIRYSAGGDSIVLYRLTGGSWDSATYDLTPFNRGYLYLTYFE